MNYGAVSHDPNLPPEKPTETQAAIAVLSFESNRPRTRAVTEEEGVSQMIYQAYCNAVGGKAFNGDPLPGWSEFVADPKKAVQANAWRLAGAMAVQYHEHLKEVNVVDPVVETKRLRKDLDAILQRVKESPRKSRERSLADTKITEAIMWLGMDLKALNEPNPYPNSKDPGNVKIEPTADGLKM